MSIIKFIIDDLKSDIKFIKDWRKGKIDVSSRIENLTKFSILDLLQEYWIWFLLLILAFMVGWMMSAFYYEIQCNELMMESMNYAKNGFNINTSILYSIVNTSVS